MRYDEMRQHVEVHFRSVLQKHKDRMLSEGDGSGQRADTLRGSLSLVEDDFWLELAELPDEQGNVHLSQFKARAGIGTLIPEQDELLLQEYRKGYRSFLTAALEQHATFEQYDFKERPSAAVAPNSLSTAGSAVAEVVPYSIAV